MRLWFAYTGLEALIAYLRLLLKLGSRRSEDPWWWWLWAWFFYRVMNGYSVGGFDHWRYDGTSR